ncbi:angiopoietin-2-like [Biomphalaria glabrata]|uniref:Angiopoietin-2-like n=1 Tax=Biomphalaria glabrata TaxID=6526 RepID=A0A9W2YPS0_BIOGL|nr:angiopoietin-2-like [Biomphalaria glabrata]
MAFLLSLLLGVYLAPLALSDLIIYVQPEVISPVFTLQLVINCSVTNNQVPNIDIIKSVSLSRYNETIKDFYVLLSLDTQTFNLQQFVQFRHAQVSFGNLFLSLTVYNPVQSDAQAYRCNVDGDNSVLNNVSMKAKNGVRYEPNVTALIEKITRLMISEEKEKCSSKNVGLSEYNNIRSKLHFVGSSEIVKELIEPLTVKCSFPASNDSYFQDSVLRSMYILHETNGVIATISRDQPVTESGQNLSSNTIQGELYHNLSKDSYLQVTWQNMNLSDSGKYFCGAHVNYLLGQKDRFQEQLVISVQRPTFDDLVKVVYDLQREVGEEKQRREISERNVMNFHEEFKVHQKNMTIVKEELKINQQKIENVKEDVKINQQNIENVKEDVNINQQNIDNVQEDVKRNKKDVKINQQNIENNKKDVKINQQNIENFKEDVKINQQNIENVKEDLKINQRNLTSLKETIDLLQYNLSNYEGKTNYKSLLQEFQNTLYLPESCRGIIHEKERVVVTLASWLKVLCDTKTDGGGWIIFQRRINGKVDFYRGWKEYRDGFGDYDIGEFYLGNENIFKLTSTGQYDLRINLEFNNTKYFAQYKDIKVLSETEKYKLKIGTYSGNAGDDLSPHNNMYFITFDRDNDNDSTVNCAERYSGAWWYKGCHDSNLNGQWGTLYAKAMNWYQLTRRSKSVSYSEMKIREKK